MPAQIVVSESDPRPLYQQVADGIKELIARGELPEGTVLPPVRQLAADLAVNLNTIAMAYRELQKDGLIRVKQGSGSVVSFHDGAPEKRHADLRRALRMALADLALSGLSPSSILRIVSRELAAVSKSGK